MGEPGVEYVRARPHPGLSAHVAGYSGYREFSATPFRRRQAPTGSCTLILSLGPPIRLFGPAGPTGPASFLAGMHDASVITEFCGVQHGVQVDLTPLGVYELLGRPMPELTNVAPHVDELGVPELAALPEQLACDPDWARRFTRLDATLLRRLDATRARADPEVAWAWRQLVRTGGTVGIGQLAQDTGWSRRHLLTRFRTQIGLAPKPAARVLRFQRAAGLLVPRGATAGIVTAGRAEDGPGVSAHRPLADVAAACGYADHAHLVREFRALAGCTPSQYLTGRC